MSEQVQCSYFDCGDPATEELDLEWDGVPTKVCEKHYNMVENSTGYCPASCQLGYGCDESC